MGYPRHKLCIALQDLERQDAEPEEQETAEYTEYNSDENEAEVWQFDPGICG